MRINPDCVRIVILTIENNLKLGEFMQLCDLMDYPLVQSFAQDDVEYSLQQLTAEKMIVCEIERYLNGEFSYIIEDVTPEGHKLCDSFRDDSLWGKIKPYLSEFSTIAELLSSIVGIISSFGS
ncbi:MAG: DUF2513 domain-containing protein [Oscillospiraceae bacterium]|nr:DUF2513 domain-containing protein [Oscillospiraceae bacterium]